MPEGLKMTRRKLPKLIVCMTKGSVENMRNNALFKVEILDHNKLRRQKQALHECIILELKEKGFNESSDYIQDLIYDNEQILAEDEIGIVVDLKTRDDYLEEISHALQTAEREKDKNNPKDEALELLQLAMRFSERGKGILWLAERLFLTAIAVASQYYTDGGRLKCCCKYLFATFLLDKFIEADVEEPNDILSDVRDRSNGKNWLFYPLEGTAVPSESVFVAASLQLHRVLLHRAREVRQTDPSKAERMARLALRRAEEAQDTGKVAEAFIEMGISQFKMKHLNNARKTIEKALEIQTGRHDVIGICDAKMHLSAVVQRLGNFDRAAQLLTEMGELALKQGLRRHLGRALHLLGELHLREEKPELGTAHLAEAFHCFMGTFIQPEDRVVMATEKMNTKEKPPSMVAVYHDTNTEMYEEEAEQSRLMHTISSGQEKMPIFFKMVNEAQECAVARSRIIDWKNNRRALWLELPQDDLIPCKCPKHNRSIIDICVARMKSGSNLEGSIARDSEICITIDLHRAKFNME